MGAREVAPAGVVLLLAVGLTATPAWAAPRLTIEAPSTAIGDGRTAVALDVRVSPASAVTTLRDLEVSVSAGSIGAPRPAGVDGVSYELVPPRLLVDRTITIEVRARVGRRTVRASAAIAVAGVRARAPVRATGGVFDLRAPAFARLGHQESFEVSIARPSGAVPRVVANVGSIGAFEPRSDGRMRAIYRVPSAHFPQLAMIAVVGDDNAALDWIAVPLLGEARIALRSEPRASVSVDLLDQTYGPVRTDARGRADITLAVPPGAAAASTRATDRAGNESQGVLPLTAPPYGRVLVICPDTGPAVLALVARTPGEAAASLTARSSVGQLTPMTPRGEGVFVATLRAAEARAGQRYRVDVGVGAAGDPAGCDGVLDGELPGAIELGSAPQVFVAGTGPVELALALRYPGALPPRQFELAIEPSLGSARRDGERVIWTLPNHFEGRTRAQLEVRLGGGASTRVELDLAAAAPARLELATSSARVRADGRDHLRLRVRAFDRFGNVVTRPAVVVHARGSSSRPRAVADGDVVFEYRAPRSYEGFRDTLRVEVGDAEVARTIEWLPLRSPLSIAARVGWVDNGGKVRGGLAGLAVSYRLPWMRDRFTVGVELTGYDSEDRRVDSTTMESHATRVRAAPALARADVYQGAGPVAVFAAAGVGVVAARTEIESENAQSSGSGVGFAALGAAGVEVPLGYGRLTLELGYLLAPVDIAGVSGNAGGARVLGGWRLDL